VDFVEGDDSNGISLQLGRIRLYLRVWIAIVVVTTDDGRQRENEKTNITFEFWILLNKIFDSVRFVL
jgi:hypothetical protein